ncbi:MAG TPA: VWA domain-containing protein [Candidatus Bathyarchaeia archaeon]|nr:VWA domain-containing protein [Candidatus Bathyarchaeia archaeon]
MSLWFRPILILGCLALSYSPFVRAQAQDNAPPAGQEQQAPSDQDNLQVFKAQVNVVNVFFNVKDKHGMLIPNLTKDDFQVLEDGKPQTIKYFSAESNQPLTLGIMIDTSASQTRVLDIEQQSCAEFLHSVLRPKDLAFVINFDVDVDLDQDFTNNIRDLTRALNKMQINAGMGGGPPGLGGGPVPTTPRGTLLYDAIYLGADEKLKNEVGRKAMIIFTDGEDQGSRLKIQDAIEAAQKADTICYVILIADRGFYGGFGYSGDSDMQKLAQATGGRVIEVGNKQEKLKQAFDQIQNELRSQYNIGYTPTNTKLDGTYRKIQIHAKDYKVQARQGYYAVARE